MPRLITALWLMLLLAACQGQPSITLPAPGITYVVNDNVTNKEESYFQEILELWQAYLSDPRHYVQENEYWSYETYQRPDYAYVQLLLYLMEQDRAEASVQCSILGIQPVENGCYHLKAMFTEVAQPSLEVQLKYTVSVYAQETENGFRLVSALEYAKARYRTETVAGIEYIIHPEHDFQREEAERMAAFNAEIAARFGQAPISFDYAVANTTDDLSRMYGVVYNPFSLRPNPSGGMADNYNQVILAGNNSAYYPHEVVHLYTHAGFARQYHRWVDEGIAALFGGSTGYYIEWHWQKLKAFLASHPDYPLTDLVELEKDIPNGEYTTDFRYAIGGYLMHQLYEKEGMEGLFAALSAGRTDEDYFALLEAKLGVTRAGFGNYLRREMAALPPLTAAEMAALRY